MDFNQQLAKIESSIIERKNTCKLLGLLIDDKLNWSEHITYFRSKISRSLYAMNRLKHVVSSRYLKTLYDSLVHSYITYEIVLWVVRVRHILTQYEYVKKRQCVVFTICTMRILILSSELAQF